MGSCPTIETERLILRPFREADVDAYTALLQTPQVRASLHLPDDVGRYDAWLGFATWLGQWELRGTGQWALEEKASGTFVGRAGMHFPARADWPGIEIGWALHPDQWGKGYATEAGAAAVAYAFANHDVDAGLPVLTLMNRGRAIARVDFHRVAGAPPGFVPVTSGAEQAHDLQLRDAEIDSLKKRAHLAESPLKEAMDKKIAEKQAQRDALAAQKPAPPAGRSWLSTQFVELSDDKPRSQAGHALIEKFDADVSQLNLAWARAHGVSCPAAKPGEPAFAGTASCIACHAEPGEVYKGTEHSHAYATLEKVHKQFDLDCVRCHVVGTNAPGGVCRVDQVEGRKNVGCESCHGRGSLHADDPNVPVPVPEPGEQNCRVCHTPENSTAFDYATYLPKILGPGHGKPSAK